MQLKPNQPRIQQSVRHLLAGGVLAYPTEAVWGLGFCLDDEAAVEQLLALKRRPVHKGLILVSGNPAHFAFLLKRCTQEQQQRMLASWPGPNTWLVPHHGLVPAWISGRHATVAIRVSAHPVIHNLCAALGGPIVSTSANPQGLAPARTALRSRVYFGNAVHYCAGTVGRSNNPSQIRDLISGQIVRPG
ncbi:MAG: tRNA threonylcarbamoyladenosine biosynthesis protein RimN [Sphingobacteriales bacterium]|nr:MAG: tRNA threonylcarbamoyladenosine biosynthesis protein RimN [Sphingobacteriales bacterium]